MHGTPYPFFDLKGLSGLYRRNLEAMTQAGQLALEGMQTAARRQAEIVRAGMEETSALTRELNASRTPEERIARQAAAAKTALEQSVMHGRELTEILVRAGNEAVDILSRRFGESLEETGALVAQKQPR